MANANVPRGLVPVRMRNGTPVSGSFRRYYVPATDGTAIFIGDPVKTVTASADANGVQTVTRASAGDTIMGAMVAVVTAGDPPITVTRDLPIYRPASVAAYILVADDPETLFEIQEDSVGGNVGVGAIGRNADLVSGTGSTATGKSGYMLDSSTLATGSATLRIIDTVERADNDPTTATSLAKWLVMILEHQMLTATGV